MPEAAGGVAIACGSDEKGARKYYAKWSYLRLILLSYMWI